MTVCLRGWSKTASTALKLATAERIIGYQFKDVDRLYEALDQRKLPSGSPMSAGLLRERPKNTRLALVGDAHAKLYMAQKWYDNPYLSGRDWTNLAMSTLTNDHLGTIGFKMGLHECAIPNEVEAQYDMATTVEAVFAAVQMDGAGQEQLHKVMARFGLQHRLVDPIQRAWIHKAVKSKLRLPDRFFIGRHFKLQEGIFETQLKGLASQEKDNKDVGRQFKFQKGNFKTQLKVLATQEKDKKDIGRQNPVRGLWQSIERLWRRPRRELGRIFTSLRRRRRPSRSKRQPPKSVETLAKGPPPTATGTNDTPIKDAATSETKSHGEGSLGRSEDKQQAAAPKQTTEEKKPAKQAENSKTEAPTPSETTKGRRETATPKKDTSADDAGTAASGSQDATKASRDTPAPVASSQNGAATDTKKTVEPQPNKASGAKQAQEMAGGPSSPEQVTKMIEELMRKSKELSHQQRQLEVIFHELRQTGKKKSDSQMKRFMDLLEGKARIKRRIATLKNLKAQS